MNAHGSLSIAREAGRWSRARLDNYLIVAAVGVLSGIAVAQARMPIHWPGHKALFWIAPVLAARLATRTRIGATIGAMTAGGAALALGGRIAGGGGWGLLPLIVLAGVVLDAAVDFAQHRRFNFFQQLMWLAAAGLVANLICFVKRLLDPVGTFWSPGNLNDLMTAGAFHALFGFIAGLIGAATMKMHKSRRLE